MAGCTLLRPVVVGSRTRLETAKAGCLLHRDESTCFAGLAVHCRRGRAAAHNTHSMQILSADKFQGNCTSPSSRDPSPVDRGDRLTANLLVGFPQWLWRVYNSSLQANPLPTKMLTSLVGATVGDFLGQFMSGLSGYSVAHAAMVVLFRTWIDAPLGHAFYNALEKVVSPSKPRSTRSVLAKMAIDQLIYAPFGTCLFYIWSCLFLGEPGLVIRVLQVQNCPI